jgi:hypothetical protein
MALSIMTLSVKTLRKMALSRTTLNRTICCITKLSILTFGITTLIRARYIIMTRNIIVFSRTTLSINVIQQNDNRHK